MSPCRLPPPAFILADSTVTYSSVSVDDYPSSTRATRMASESPSASSQDSQTQLPGFGELLDSLPETQRTLSTICSPSSSPPTPRHSWYAPARNLHSRGEPHRANWHPYAPPVNARGYSRSESPAASDNSEDGPQPRSARPTYTEEEIYFIWYHRDDLQLPWPQILELFNVHFGMRVRNGVQGIQCRYYRALDIHGVPKSRARDRSLPNEHYGVRHYMPDKFWTWMRN